MQVIYKLNMDETENIGGETPYLGVRRIYRQLENGINFNSF